MEYYTLKDGTVLSYEKMGTGRPVLFLHGWAGDVKSYWGDIMPQLDGQKYCAIGLNQRGSGNSAPSKTRPVTHDLMIDDVRDFLEGNNLKNTTLVGSSQGGSIVLGYIGKYGCDEYLHSAVLVDIAPRNVMDENDPSYIWGQYGGKWKLEDALKGVDTMRKDYNKFFTDFILGVDPKIRNLPDDERTKAIAAYFESVNTDELAEEYESDLYADHREAVPKITVPLGYFYAGGENAFFTDKLEDYYRERVKGPYYAVNFHDDNHLFFWQRPDEFAKELNIFLDKYSD